MALLDVWQKLRHQTVRHGAEPGLTCHGPPGPAKVPGIRLPPALQRRGRAHLLDRDVQFDFNAWLSQRASRSPLDQLPFTPLINCEPPTSYALMSRFDWHFVPESAGLQKLSWPPYYHDCGSLDRTLRAGCCLSTEPRAVWAAPHLVRELLDFAAERLDNRTAGRVVVFTGTEMPLSVAFGSTDAERRATVARLRRYFGAILYQTKDVDLEHVRAAPMGLCWLYMMKLVGLWLGQRTRRRLAHRFADLDAALRVDIAAKTKGVLASFGELATFLDDNKTILDTIVAMSRGMLVTGNASSSLAAIAAAWESRFRLRRWSATAAAREVPVEVRQIPMLEWWAELGKYRFLLSPIGSGIQTSKTFEALMVLTVPIVQRMNFSLHDELVDLGFPIVLVDQWEEVSQQRVGKWWDELAPRLESFRLNCLTVDGYWRIYTGQFGYCT